MSENGKSPYPARDGLVEIFSATLRPYRSLSRNGFIILMLLFGGTCFCMGFFYVVAGAWPVFGFLGIDVLILYIAFKANYRSARAFEEIIVRRDALIVRRISPRGQIREMTFNPFWAKLHVKRDEEDIVTHISIASKGEYTDIGAFLNPDDKTTFAKAFGAALAQARA